MLKKKTCVLFNLSTSLIFKLHDPASILEYRKNVKLRQTQFHIKYIGKPSSRKLRRAIYHTLCRMDAQQTIVLATSGIHMAPHGSTLSQRRATASRNILKYLPGSPETVWPNIAAALQGRLIGRYGGDIYVSPPWFLCVFLYVCATNNCLVRFLRVHPVQSVINSPTQLSGRGFPHIFYTKLFLLQLYVFLVLRHGSRAV